MNRRRRVVVAAGLVPLSLPLVGLTQPAQGVRRIGFLSLSKAGNAVDQQGASMLRDSLQGSGWVEGRNLAIERRYAEGDANRLDGLAKELVDRKVELILAVLTTPTAAAKRATSNIPIVMLGAISPVELGFVQSLARPGGNVTGTASPGLDTAAKSIQILREVAPNLTRLAMVSNPTNPAGQTFNETRIRTANLLGMTAEVIAVSQPDDIPAALERIVGSRAQMLLVNNDGAILPRLGEFTSFAIQHKILSIGTATVFTTVGGALYYGSNLQELIDRTVSYIDRILRGAKPADLPIEQPTNFDLIVNLKTMRAIGIAVPQSILVRATEVIQ
jgi:putative ABC transport system substrate-binding protein